MRLSSAPGADTHSDGTPRAATEANETSGAGGKAVANLSQLTLISSIGWAPDIFVARSLATSCASSGDAISILGVDIRSRFRTSAVAFASRRSRDTLTWPDCRYSQCFWECR